MKPGMVQTASATSASKTRQGAGVPAPALGCGSVLVTHALVTFILAASLLVVLPGPDSLLVVRSIMLKGRRAAVTTTAGVLSGLAVWVAAAALGLAALLHASHVGYTALRIVGAVYLVTLGVQALRSAQRPAALVDRDRGPGVLGVGYRAGLVTNLLNPKIGVFFVTFLPGFVPAGAPVGPTSLLLGAVFVTEGALYFAVAMLSWVTNTIVSPNSACSRMSSSWRVLRRMRGIGWIGRWCGMRCRGRWSGRWRAAPRCSRAAAPPAVAQRLSLCRAAAHRGADSGGSAAVE